jgi:hypothetical protein
MNGMSCRSLIITGRTRKIAANETMEGVRLSLYLCCTITKRNWSVVHVTSKVKPFIKWTERLLDVLDIF